MSAGSQSSESDSKLYGPGMILLPSQKRSLGMFAPSLLEGAMQGGFSPNEGQRIQTRMNENVNRGAEGAMQGLRDQYAKAGLTGGVMKGDIGNILEAKQQGYGETAKNFELMNRDEDAARKARLMQFALWHPPFGTGSSSEGSGWNAGI
jgi:hypothetical protein